jgi:DNA-binding PadR family transcriptional regulator
MISILLNRSLLFNTNKVVFFSFIFFKSLKNKTFKKHYRFPIYRLSIMKGFLKLIVLMELSKNDMSGYDLINNIESVMGKKPSPGSIYPLMNELIEDKFVSLKEDGRKKIYSITKLGNNHTQRIIKEKQELALKHFEFLKLIKSLSKDDGEKDILLLNKLHEKNCCSIKLHHMEKWIRLRDIAFDIITQNKYKDNKEKIEKIIDSTIEKLEKIRDN